MLDNKSLSHGAFHNMMTGSRMGWAHESRYDILSLIAAQKQNELQSPSDVGGVESFLHWLSEELGFAASISTRSVRISTTVV